MLLDVRCRSFIVEAPAVSNIFFFFKSRAAFCTRVITQQSCVLSICDPLLCMYVTLALIAANTHEHFPTMKNLGYSIFDSEFLFYFLGFGRKEFPSVIPLALIRRVTALDGHQKHSIFFFSNLL